MFVNASVRVVELEEIRGKRDGYGVGMSGRKSEAVVGSQHIVITVARACCKRG